MNNENNSENRSEVRCGTPADRLRAVIPDDTLAEIAASEAGQPAAPTSLPITIRSYETAAPAQPQKKAAKKARSGLSLPARIGLWIVGVASGLTILMLCAVAWIFGISYIDDAVNGKQQPAAPQQSSGSNGQSGNSGNGSNFFYFPDGSGGFYIPGNGNGNGGSGSYPGSSIFPDINGNDDDDDEAGSSDPTGAKPGIGATVSELKPDLPIEGYSSGILIQSLREDSAFAGKDVKPYDLILAMDGAPTPTLDALDEQLTKHNVGDKVTVTLARYESGVARLFTVDIELIDINAD